MIDELLTVLNQPEDHYIHRCSRASQEFFQEQKHENKTPRFEKVQKILSSFNTNNVSTFTFPELRTSESKREKLFGFLFEVLREGKTAETDILADETEQYRDDLKDADSLSAMLFGLHRSLDKTDLDRKQEGTYDDPQLLANLTLLKLTCLETIRILSRDKALYHPHCVSEENMLILIRLIRTDPFQLEAMIQPDPKTSVQEELGDGQEPPSLNLSAEEKLQILEAQKCLCNFVFNDSSARTIIAFSLCPQIIMSREPWFWKDPGLRELVFFDARLLFLLTALVPELRLRLAGFNDDAFKDVTLPKLTQLITYFAFARPDPSSGQCRDKDLDVVNELLKVAFNVTMNVKQDKRIATPQQPAQVEALTAACRELLFAAGDEAYCSGPEKTDEMVGHVINLLTNIPPSDYWQLIPTLSSSNWRSNVTGDVVSMDESSCKRKINSPGTERFRVKLIKVDLSQTAGAGKLKHDDKEEEELFETVEEYDMTAISSVLDFLSSRLALLDEVGGSGEAGSNYETTRRAKETLIPCLLFLTEASKQVRPIRKWLKRRILPPLTAQDVQSLPEQGSTVRNRLCRLLTSPSTDVKELAAELLFTLCKENVARMIKYTGYGNAAGLFARLGLLKGGRGPNSDAYSSASSSEDENKRGEAGAAYERVLPDINPVTGRYEPRGPIAGASNDDSPGSRFGGGGGGMTDEEKEAEALELVRLMERLRQNGVIQPMKVGKDGKPVPFETEAILRQAEREMSGQPDNFGLFDRPD